MEPFSPDRIQLSCAIAIGLSLTCSSPMLPGFPLRLRGPPMPSAVHTEAVGALNALERVAAFVSPAILTLPLRLVAAPLASELVLLVLSADKVLALARTRTILPPFV